MGDHQHNRVHVKVVRRVAETNWDGSNRFVRLDLVDAHGTDAHLYVRSDSYLGKQATAGNELEVHRK